MFKKGVVTNPHGRPSVHNSLAHMVRTSLEKKDLSDPKKRTNIQIILDKMIQLSKAGDVKATEFLAERGYGKVKSELDVTTQGHSLNKVAPLEISFVEVQAQATTVESNDQTKPN